jgi:hypothetical protein
MFKCILYVRILLPYIEIRITWRKINSNQVILHLFGAVEWVWELWIFQSSIGWYTNFHNLVFWTTSETDFTQFLKVHNCHGENDITSPQFCKYPKMFWGATDIVWPIYPSTKWPKRSFLLSPKTYLFTFLSFLSSFNQNVISSEQTYLTLLRRFCNSLPFSVFLLAWLKPLT